MSEAGPARQDDALDRLLARGVESHFVEPVLLVVDPLLKVDYRLARSAGPFEARCGPDLPELEAKLTEALVLNGLIKAVSISAVGPHARLDDLFAIDSEPLHVLVTPLAEHVIPCHDLSPWVLLCDMLDDSTHELSVERVRSSLFLEELTVPACGQVENLISPNVQEGHISQHLHVLVYHAAHKLERLLLQGTHRSEVVRSLSQMREPLSLQNEL